MKSKYKYLPFEKLTLQTSLKSEEIEERLINEIEYSTASGRKIFGIFNVKPSKNYSGTVGNGKFKIQRVINYRNSFLPVVLGEIRPYLYGCEIDLTLRLNHFVFGFMIFWFSGVILGCLAMMIAITKYGFEGPMLIPLGMLVFGIVLTLGAFKSESKRTRNDLIRIFEAKEIE